MSLSFSLGCFIIVLIIALYVVFRRCNLRTSRFVLHSEAKDTLDEHESLIWIIGTLLLALSGATRLLLESTGEVTGVLNPLTLGMSSFAVLLWVYAIVRLVWLKRTPSPNEPNGNSTRIPAKQSER